MLRYDASGARVSVNLDIKNPNAREDLAHRPPEELAASILEKERRIAEIVAEIREMLAGAGR